MHPAWAGDTSKQLFMDVHIIAVLSLGKEEQGNIEFKLKSCYQEAFILESVIADKLSSQTKNPNKEKCES